jgi:TAT (twin-arginine translocation) pathway signal sequence
MNRRGFLKALGIGTAAAATGAIALLDQELWTPSRTFFLPPAGGWAGGNQLLTISQITGEALRVLEQNLQFRTVRQYVINNDELPMRVEGAYLNVRRPPRYAFQELNQIVHGWQA